MNIENHLDGPVEPIMLDSDIDAWVLPASSPRRYASGVSVWKDDCQGFRLFALYHARNTALTCDDDGESFVCEVPIQFEARPDNEYNPDALAVVVPHWLREQVGARHIGYMYDRNLNVFGPAIRRLMRATGRPVVCTAILPFDRPGLLSGETYESVIKDGYIDSEGVSLDLSSDRWPGLIRFG